MFESNRTFSAARIVKARAMALKAVVPGISKSAKDRELLDEDLLGIGCHGLMGKPWRLAWKTWWWSYWEQGQPVARSRAPGPGKMDSKGVEEGLRLYRGGQRNGVSDRPVH